MSERDPGPPRARALTPDRRALPAQQPARSGASPAPGEPATRIPRRDPSAPVPLSFAQQRLWFMDQLAPGSAFYNVPFVVPLAGAVDADALRWSLDELVARHEALRTSFPTVDGTP